MAGNDAVALRGASRLTLAVSEHYTITEGSDAGWQVHRAAYFYAIGLHDTGELLAYHWHPRGKSPVVDPHLHVRANIQLGERWLGKVHLPTGPIELVDPSVSSSGNRGGGVRPVASSRFGCGEDWAQRVLSLRFGS